MLNLEVKGGRMGGIEMETSNFSTKVIQTPFGMCEISKSSSFRDVHLVEILWQAKLPSQNTFRSKEGCCASKFVEKITPNHTWEVTSIFLDYLLLCLHV